MYTRAGMAACADVWVNTAMPVGIRLRAERTLISGVSLFDRYEGDKVAEGKVSLGIEVVLQPRDHTLTDAEIDAASGKIVAAVAKATGAVLR